MFKIEARLNGACAVSRATFKTRREAEAALAKLSAKASKGKLTIITFNPQPGKPGGASKGRGLFAPREDWHRRPGWL